MHINLTQLTSDISRMIVMIVIPVLEYISASYTIGSNFSKAFKWNSLEARIIFSFYKFFFLKNNPGSIITSSVFRLN